MRSIPQDCELLRNIRLAMGWTQADMAERLGVSFQAVSQWERGDRALPVAMAWRYVRNMDCRGPGGKRARGLGLDDIYPEPEE